MIKEVKIKIMGCHVHKRPMAEGKKGFAYGISGAAASHDAELSKLQILLAMAVSEAESRGLELSIGLAPIEGAKAEPEGPEPQQTTH